ncbi:Structure-specific endonuclease subunit SLX4 2 [Candida viswanathii]|uniref:Structure-specific endonuclease subunit SLX4 n=1 Tax=Candida viswanathii TaxID=5486 RepID=A0A367XZR0_9ASCO|nr:Structure-specific endonuclease subunit SLX4 2 [Candida viswanathii]
MQSIHEETIAQESHEKAIRRSISLLSSFKHEAAELGSAATEPPAPKVVRQITTKSNRRKLTGKEEGKSVGETRRPASAKLQGCIDGFLRNDFGHLDGENGRSSKLLSHAEWEAFAEGYEKTCVRDKSMRKSIQRYYRGHEEERKNTCWWWCFEQAMSGPDEKMTKEELKSMYDLDSSFLISGSTITTDEDRDAEEGPFTVVLSQTKSQPVEEELNLYAHADSIQEIQPTQELFNTPAYDPQDTENKSDPLIIVLEEKVVSTQPDPEEAEIILDSEPEPEVVSSKVQVLRSMNESTPAKPKQPSVEVEEVVSDSTPIASPVKAQLPRKNVVQVPSSEPASPIKQHLPPANGEEEVFTGIESIYSTARTSFDTPKHASPVILLSLESDTDEDEELVSSMPAVKPTPKKRMRSTVLEISAALRVQNYTDERNNIKLRKIGKGTPKKVAENDDDEVIPDSQEVDDNSVSIVEITRKVPAVDYSGDESTDLFQPDELSKLTATQLREKFKLWELKPVQGKLKMVDILHGISNFILPEQLLLVLTDKQQLQRCIFSKLNNVIRDDPFWYDRVLSFEPIRLEDLQAFLHAQCHSLELDVLRAYCDSTGITTTNA